MQNQVTASNYVMLPPNPGTPILFGPLLLLQRLPSSSSDRPEVLGLRIAAAALVHSFEPIFPEVLQSFPQHSIIAVGENIDTSFYY